MLANVLAQFTVLRIDLTADRRYTLSPDTKQLLRNLSGDTEVTLYLNGSFNSGFTRLSRSAVQLLNEMKAYTDLSISLVNPNKLSDSDRQALVASLARHNLHPTAIYETTGNGSRSETLVYPFALVRYQGREQFVSLLENRRDLSGAENLNHSAESLEYKFALCLRTLQNPERHRILFLEGQGELPEQNTKDVESLLAEHFDIYRGALNSHSDCLNPFSAVIVADPQTPFSEADKYVLDQYIMQGGSVLWLVNGVQFSEQVLEDEGFTPALALDLNLTDMLFRYGVRINNHLLQDLQCLSIPVDVSRNPDQPQWQPMPWTYAPLLLTSNISPITANLSPVSATFCSDLSSVGDNPDLQSTILLASSDHATLIPVPGEVDLGDLNHDPRLFTLAYLPVAVSLDGIFPSVFEHRMIPESIEQHGEKLAQSCPARQIVVASGSVISNDLQQGQPLPAGYDRYSRIQFANRDFILNSVLWLTDYSDLLPLRQKIIPLRLLNKNRLNSGIALPVSLSLILPLLILALTGIIVQLVRKHKYTL